MELVGVCEFALQTVEATQVLEQGSEHPLRARDEATDLHADGDSRVILVLNQSFRMLTGKVGKCGPPGKAVFAGQRLPIRSDNQIDDVLLRYFTFRDAKHLAGGAVGTIQFAGFVEDHNAILRRVEDRTNAGVVLTERDLRRQAILHLRAERVCPLGHDVFQIFDSLPGLSFEFPFLRQRQREM